MVSKAVPMAFGVTLGILGACALAVSLIPFPSAPLKLHAWLPLPVACVQYSCVTYAQWYREVSAGNGEGKPEELLSSLLETRAVRTVASREGVRVRAADVEQALTGVRDALGTVPGGVTLLAAAYGPRHEEVLRKKFSDLLLREKVAALGISSPWDASVAPGVRMWNIHLRWDAERHVVVPRALLPFARAQRARSQ